MQTGEGGTSCAMLSVLFQNSLVMQFRGCMLSSDLKSSELPQSFWQTNLMLSFYTRNITVIRKIPLPHPRVHTLGDAMISQSYSGSVLLLRTVM